MTGITHGQYKVALNSVHVASFFLSNVQIPMTVPNCSLITMTGGVNMIGG